MSGAAPVARLPTIPEGEPIGATFNFALNCRFVPLRSRIVGDPTSVTAAGG